MGKRNYGRGIIDRRYRKDGSPTGYKGELPFRVECFYSKASENYKQRKSECFPNYKEALDWKVDQDEQKRNRDNRGYQNSHALKERRKYKVCDVILSYIDYLKNHNGAKDNSGDVRTLHNICGKSYR
jgi:hypothetical protein